MNKDFNGISFVFDIDDTICNNKNRDYANAIPYTNVIDKINNLHDRGATIKLYTSRGMVSCNGDLQKMIAKNKDVLEKWLNSNGVKYDELIFGKPIADMYIDDKTMSVRDFIKQDFCKLNGRSGYSVTRIGNIVKKEMSEKNFKKLNDWYEASSGIAKSPERISNLYTTMYMEYIDGKGARDVISKKLLNKIIDQILVFSATKYQTFDKQRLIQKIKDNQSDDEEWNRLTEDCINMIKQLDMESYATLSHADLTLANIVVKDGDIYLLDSMFEQEASSYLMDFAKLKMSLDGYEALFCNGNEISTRYAKMLSKKLKKLRIYKQVLVLEYMYAIRLYNYNENKDLVKEFVRKVRKEIV